MSQQWLQSHQRSLCGLPGGRLTLYMLGGRMNECTGDTHPASDHWQCSGSAIYLSCGRCAGIGRPAGNGQVISHVLQVSAVAGAALAMRQFKHARCTTRALILAGIQ